MIKLNAATSAEVHPVCPSIAKCLERIESRCFMATGNHPSPRHYAGITVSSTFTDLEDHRAALIKAIKAHGLTDVAMENDAAKLLDVIDSSLEMVGMDQPISVSSARNMARHPMPAAQSDNLSITELEFNEALRLNRPILLFIMGKSHLVLEDDIEASAAKKKKLNAFRERAKNMSADSLVHRVYATFESLEDFKEKIGPSIAELRRHLDGRSQLIGISATEGRTSALTTPSPSLLPSTPSLVISVLTTSLAARLNSTF